jgi:hypothetical protein
MSFLRDSLIPWGDKLSHASFPRKRESRIYLAPGSEAFAGTTKKHPFATVYFAGVTPFLILQLDLIITDINVRRKPLIAQGKDDIKIPWSRIKGKHEVDSF